MPKGLPHTSPQSCLNSGTAAPPGLGSRGWLSLGVGPVSLGPGEVRLKHSYQRSHFLVEKRAGLISFVYFLWKPADGEEQRKGAQLIGPGSTAASWAPGEGGA